MKLSRSILLIFLSLMVTTLLQAQVNRFTKVKRQPLSAVYFLNETKGKTFKGKDLKEHWIVYSDRDNNPTYEDAYAQKPLSKIELMRPCLIIGEKNNFYELVAYNAELLPPPTGIFAAIFNKKKKYRFKEPKEAEYLGWVPKNQLLSFSTSLAAKENLRPFKYLTGLSVTENIEEQLLFLKNDSLVFYRDPLLIDSATLRPLEELLYLYKTSKNGKNYLMGTSPRIFPDSAHHVVGWAPKELFLPYGQHEILIPNQDRIADKKSKAQWPLFYIESDIRDYYHGNNTAFDINEHSDAAIKYLPSKSIPTENKKLPNKTDESIFPLSITDPASNKVLNVNGHYITYSKHKEIKQNLKKVNVIIVFEDTDNARKKLLPLTNSIQNIYNLTKTAPLDKKQFQFGAVGYNSALTTELPLTSSFINWLEFVQEKFDQPAKGQSSQNNKLTTGLSKAASLLAQHKNEDNIIVLIGEKVNVSDSLTLSKVSQQLADVSASLIFLQTEAGVDKGHSEFILQAKSILANSGEKYSYKKREQIVDFKLVKNNNDFTLIDETLNAFFFDFPANSMARGGVVFPSLQEQLPPTILDRIIDTLFQQMLLDNKQILGSLKESFKGVGVLRNKLNPLINFAMNKQGHPPLLHKSKLFDNRHFFVNFNARQQLEHGVPLVFNAGYLLRDFELTGFVNGLRKLVPPPPPSLKITKSIRKKWFRSLRKNYKELNKFYRFEGKAKNVRWARLLFMNTGIPFQDKAKEITLRDIKRKRRLDHYALHRTLDSVRKKVDILEAYTIENRASRIINNGQISYLIPATYFP